MFAKVFIALVAATSFVVATSVPQKRSDVATCDFVISPVTPLPSTANLVAEINFVINRNFAVAVTGSDITGTNTFTGPNADGTFSVHSELSAEGKTGAESAAILGAFQGQTEPGFSTNWVFETATCTA